MEIKTGSKFALIVGIICMFFAFIGCIEIIYLFIDSKGFQDDVLGMASFFSIIGALLIIFFLVLGSFFFLAHKWLKKSETQKKGAILLLILVLVPFILSLIAIIPSLIFSFIFILVPGKPEILVRAEWISILSQLFYLIISIIIGVILLKNIWKMIKLSNIKNH